MQQVYGTSNLEIKRGYVEQARICRGDRSTRRLAYG
jgi:hypothetical protein